jgi:hypothetical protein
MELDHTSHSAVEMYKKCPQRFYLERVLNVETTHHIAGPAGSAFHTMTEDYDNGLAVRPYQQYLDENLEPGVPYTHSRDENYGWWVVHGELMFRQYKEWRNATGWEIEAVEEEFRIQPAGLQWPVVGFIDRRFRSQRTGTHIICDIKTGYRIPDKSAQLPIYYVADGIRRVAGVVGGVATTYPGGAGSGAAPVRRTAGDEQRHRQKSEGFGVATNYYDARRGDSTGLEWPTWNEGDLVRHIQPVERGILADDWTANPGPQCRYCPVRQHCEFKKGK